MFTQQIRKHRLPVLNYSSGNILFNIWVNACVSTFDIKNGCPVTETYIMHTYILGLWPRGQVIDPQSMTKLCLDFFIQYLEVIFYELMCQSPLVMRGAHLSSSRRVHRDGSIRLAQRSSSQERQVCYYVRIVPSV